MDTIIKLKEKKRILLITKLIMCILIFFLIVNNAFLDGLSPYYSFRDLVVQNEFSGKQTGVTTDYQIVTQKFISRGNFLNRIYLFYYGDALGEDEFTITLMSKDGNVIKRKTYSYADYESETWNDIDFKVSGLEVDAEYSILFDKGKSDIKVVMSESSEENQHNYTTYTDCYVDNVNVDGYASIGFQFTFRYMTYGNIFYLGLRLLLISLFGLILCYGIIHIERLYEVYLEGGETKSILYGIYISMYILSLYNPLDAVRTEIENYTREMGIGLLSGYDVTKTIANFTNCFLIFGVSFIINTLTANYFIKKEKNKEQNYTVDFLNNLIILGNVDMILRAITYYRDESVSNSVFSYTSVIIAVMILLSIMYIVLKMDRYITVKAYYQFIMCSSILALPITFIVNAEWESGRLLIGAQVFFIVITIISIKIMGKNVQKLEKVKFFDISIIFFSLIPFLTSLYIENINILNQYSIFIQNPKRNYILASILYLVVGCIFGVSANYKKWRLEWWKRWSNLWLVVGCVSLNQQIALVNVYEPDIFEAANYSTLIQGFLKFGEIPIVENLGHHMMQDVWEGILYGIINQDFAGAIVSPYSGMVMIPLAVIFYLFICRVWDENIALGVTLLIPFYDSWSGYAWGILVCIAVVAFAEKNTIFRATMIWLACVWCALNRADLGVSFGVACVMTLFVYILRERNWKAIRMLLIPLSCIVMFFAMAWCILCEWKGINPIIRLIEFIELFAASINWTWNGVGSNTFTVYSVAYIFVPVALIVSLVYIIFCKKFKENVELSRWLLLLMLGFAYFGNYTRTLTRHSIHELATDTVFWTAYIFGALFISCLVKKKAIFIPVYIGFILLNTLFTSMDVYSEQSIANTMVEKIENYADIWEQWEIIADNKKVEQRVIYSSEFQEILLPYEFVIDSLLDEDDTFIDFIYNSYIYSVFGRNNPVYIAQSPTMLSGELSQEYFIDEVQKNKNNIPIVFMPNESEYHAAIDEIKLNYKYYKVAEFVYENYRPLCNYEKFSVWCLNDRYEEMFDKLSDKCILEDENKKNIFIDWNYAPNLHKYSLNRLPLYWAELDEKQAAHNEVLNEAVRSENNIFILEHITEKDKQKGNYLLLTTSFNGYDNSGMINDDEYIDASIIMGMYQEGVFVEKCRYNFALKEGEHNYLFRVSSDYYWMLGKINAVELECDAKVNGTRMKILRGD